MAIATFLAATAAEMRNFSVFPSKTAWMACHFSPYGLGLSNLPKALPPGSLLILNDVTPPHGHDPSVIARQLADCIENLQCCGILLDFQREGSEETQLLANHLSQGLTCPVIVSEPYASNLDCPVFLPPVPPSMPLPEHLVPWKDREIWLELGLGGETVTLTETGCTVAPLSFPDTDTAGFSEEKLHCHYTVHLNEKSARFTLWRTKEDLDQLLEEAAAFGITTAVGLYQELKEQIW